LYQPQYFDLPEMINAGGGNTLLSDGMMRQWHFCFPCYCHTGYDAMWKGRGAPTVWKIHTPYPPLQTPGRTDRRKCADANRSWLPWMRHTVGSLDLFTMWGQVTLL